MELTECVRTDDAWLFEVQQEMRQGRLSDDSWNFLHGRPTTVPGSWSNGDVVCGNAECRKLQGTKDIQLHECQTCRDERKEKCRVITSFDDARLKEEKFINAPAIFPNNDIKCEIAKKRARIFAAESQQAITWSKAHDSGNSAVLSENPDVTHAKLEWLKRHDKDCAGLYGMLPLIKGMPVALTEHLDRNPTKNLLKGKVGDIDSWVEDEREDSAYDSEKRILRYVPRVVFVQYYDWIWSEEQQQLVKKTLQLDHARH